MLIIWWLVTFFFAFSVYIFKVTESSIVKPKFSLKVNAPRKSQRLKTKPESKAEAVVYRKDIRSKESKIQTLRQLNGA